MNPWLLDGFVILVYFTVVIGIGLYKGRGERTMEGFAVGDRNIAWWAVLASICAAEVSAGTFLGTPGEGYGLRNFTYGQLAIGTVLARIIVAYLFIGRFYELRVVSIYEFLDVRFGHTTKLASSLVFLITRALASGSRMFVPAILLVVAWQLIRDMHPNRTETMWLYVGAVAFLVLITAIYTTFGGIKAVVCDAHVRRDDLRHLHALEFRGWLAGREDGSANGPGRCRSRRGQDAGSFARGGQ
jgi:Na+/proline symporter